MVKTSLEKHNKVWHLGGNTQTQEVTSRIKTAKLKTNKVVAAHALHGSKTNPPGATSGSELVAAGPVGVRRVRTVMHSGP